MAHVLSGIPEGSEVRVLVGGRFQHFKNVLPACAILIEADETNYPLNVSVRPKAVKTMDTVMAKKPDGSGSLAVSREERMAGRIGMALNFDIVNPDDCYFPGSPLTLAKKHGKTQFISVKLLTDTPALDPYNIYDRDIVPKAPPDGLCMGTVWAVKPEDATNERPPVWTDCKSPRHAPFELCTLHATEAGLIAAPTPVAPPVPVQRRGRKPGSKNKHPRKSRQASKPVLPTVTVTPVAAAPDLPEELASVPTP